MTLKGIKRKIFSVTIEHLMDNDADTSYLGTYSSSAEGDYSINRRHDVDCTINNRPQGTLDKLDRISAYLGSLLPDNWASDEYQALNEAQDIIAEAQEAVAECDCGGMYLDRNSCEYFNPSDNYTDCTPEDQRKYALQDYARMEALNDGAWHYIGIRVSARVGISMNGGKDYLTQSIGSGGLWGIESDSDKAFMDETEADELADLKAQLIAFGFGRSTVAKAIKNAVRSSD